MKDKKTSSIFKSLAIIGFVAIIILVSWLSILMVNFLPTAFNSLASLSEALNQETQTITENESPQNLNVTSNSNVVSTNEMVNLAWDQANIRGTYTFSYICKEGVSLTIVDGSNGNRNISCATNYNIGNTINLSLLVESEKERFTNVDYEIGFLATNDTTPRAVGNSSFTVVNTSINDLVIEDVTEGDENEEVEISDTETQTETEVTTNNPTTPTPPTFEQEFVYSIPTSDPNGRTDLSVRYLFAGSINGNRFVPGAVEKDDDGAIQFEVKNLGTKTSEEWTFSMTLPNGGSFNGEEQEPLKPNERAIITLGFPTGDEDDFTFRVSVDEDTDRNSNNDRFSQEVNFID